MLSIKQAPMHYMALYIRFVTIRIDHIRLKKLVL